MDNPQDSIFTQETHNSHDKTKASFASDSEQTIMSNQGHFLQDNSFSLYLSNRASFDAQPSPKKFMAPPVQNIRNLPPVPQAYSLSMTTSSNSSISSINEQKGHNINDELNKGLAVIEEQRSDSGGDQNNSSSGGGKGLNSLRLYKGRCFLAF